MADKTFSAKHAAVPLKVVGFASVDAFVALKIGAFHTGNFNLCLTPAEARDLAAALLGAANFAEPPAATAADLGIAAE